MNMDVENLRRKLEKITKEKETCAKKINKSIGEKYQLLREKYKLLNEEYWLVRDKLDYYESSLIASNDEIEIKRFGNEIESIYWIYLKDLKTKIGHIYYEGYHNSIIVGDIGYVIDSRFNGHNYAYKALCLLSSYLYENGISDFYISVFHGNTPSIKTIEKYGGTIIHQDKSLTTYKCETRENKKYLRKCY